MDHPQLAPSQKALAESTSQLYFIIGSVILFLGFLLFHKEPTLVVWTMPALVVWTIPLKGYPHSARTGNAGNRRDKSS